MQADTFKCRNVQLGTSINSLTFRSAKYQEVRIRATVCIFQYPALRPYILAV